MSNQRCCAPEPAPKWNRQLGRAFLESVNTWRSGVSRVSRQACPRPPRASVAAYATVYVRTHLDIRLLSGTLEGDTGRLVLKKAGMKAGLQARLPALQCREHRDTRGGHHHYRDPAERAQPKGIRVPS